MFESNLASTELVFFWDGESIDKAMMFSDFEATLDGYVGLQAYARENKRAAYIQLDDALKVRAVVLFTIAFDEAGFAERSWNLPLRHMAEIAGRGPDMGAGPINLVCRSQCSISWHAPKLWDPVMQGHNTFSQIAEQVGQAAPRFGLKPKRRAAPPPAYAPAYVEEDIPVLSPEEEAPVLTDAAPVAPAPEAPPAAWTQERSQMLERLAEQQLHINTLTNDKNETVARLGLLHQQQVDILEAQNSKLLGQHKAMKAQADALREQVEVLQRQVAGLQGMEQSMAAERKLHEEQLAAVMHAKVGEETQRFEDLLKQKEQEYAAREARIKADYKVAVEQRLAEESVRFKTQLEALRTEVGRRDDTIAELGRQLAAVKAEQAQREEGAADEFLRRLESLGMNFVVFHPGAGHVSVPVAELAGYASNPMAYVAAKCLVGEEQYRAWLMHYENPRCTAAIGDNKCCEARLIRTDSPTKFVGGQSDRCARHQAADTAIDNVLRFR
ncbi:MAG TPA: hypothetical protein VFV15_04365 [Moraxellaceae bacterium]|nr:hypothetical protein [Moraxellaceae bacterium]